MNRYLQQSAAADGNRIGSSPVPSLRFLHCYTNIQLTGDICSSLEMAVSGARPRRRRRLSRELVSRPGRRESDAPPAVSAPALQTGTGTVCSVDHSVDWVRTGDRQRCDPLAVMQHTLLIQIFRIRSESVSECDNYFSPDVAGMRVALRHRLSPAPPAPRGVRCAVRWRVAPGCWAAWSGPTPGQCGTPG